MTTCIMHRDTVRWTEDVITSRGFPEERPLGTGFRVPRDAPVSDRIQFHVAVDVETRCWNWLAFVDRKGYGRFGLKGWPLAAHRASYLAFVGPIPDGLQIDHLCRNRRCVNPDHLEAVTPRVNCLRGEGVTAQNAGKTHCPSGHPYDEENTYRWGGRRYCRTCGGYAQAKASA